MARDLIPPSSPAGRPAPDGDAEPDRAAAGAGARRHRSRRCPSRSGPSQFRNRFGFLLGALAGILIAAALVGVVVLSTGGRERVDDGLAAELVPLAADGHDRRWPARRRSPSTSRASTATRTASSSRWSRAIPLHGRPSRCAPASGAINLFDEHRVALHGSTGSGRTARSWAEGIRGAPEAGPARGARTRALHVPLPAGRRAGRDAACRHRRRPRTGQTPPRHAPQTAAHGARMLGQGGRRELASGRSAIFYRPGDLKPQLQVPLGDRRCPADGADAGRRWRGEAAVSTADAVERVQVALAKPPARPSWCSIASRAAGHCHGGCAAPRVDRQHTRFDRSRLCERGPARRARIRQVSAAARCALRRVRQLQRR